ncbi:MAG: aldo/keto reductase [Rudaea sp.]|uniref:aldo/keto reductase n=1 Tax=Rudaea sp. TaxID=2136325 RepID=UPI0039E5C63A
MSRPQSTEFPDLGPLGFGTAPLGNLYAAVDEREAHATLAAAWQRGIRYFDTAPFYGHGLSEQRLGDAFATRPRGEFAVSTKVGRLIEADAGRSGRINDGFAVSGSRAVFDYSRDGVRRSFEASLRRLRLDRVDILLLHDVGRLTHGERHATMLAQALAEALPEMARLREEGLVGAIGLGVNEQEVCLEILPRFPLDCVMLAGRYTLLEQQASRELMREAQARRVKILVAGPYNSGLLADARGPGATYDYAPVDAATLERARTIYAICAQASVDVGAAALRFPLAHPAVATVVAGMRSVDEVESAAARRDAVVPAALWQRLQDAGLLPSDVALPS